MKKCSLLLAMLLCFFVSTINMKATCKEMIEDAKDIKVSKYNYFPKEEKYEEDTGMLIDETFVGIKITGISDKYYIIITNDENDEEIVVKYEDTENGTYLVRTPNLSKNVKMTVDIYSNDSDACDSTDILRAKDIKTDIYNQYYRLNICQENKDLELCEPMMDNEDISTDEFVNKVKEAIRIRDLGFFGRIWEFVKNYWLFIIIPLAVVSIVYFIRIFFIKREMKKNEK